MDDINTAKLANLVDKAGLTVKCCSDQALRFVEALESPEMKIYSVKAI